MRKSNKFRFSLICILIKLLTTIASCRDVKESLPIISGRSQRMNSTPSDGVSQRKCEKWKVERSCWERN